MNIEYFRESLDLYSFGGLSLSPEQILLVENSLIVLQSDSKLKDIFFWGRISGIEKDYYLAYGYTKDCLTKRKFYYSNNCYDWLMLPEPRPDIYEACIICEDMFLGDPTIYNNVELDKQYAAEGSIKSGTESMRGPFQKIKEEDRLSCIVQMITDESALIPRGGLYKMLDGSIVYNPMFRGLNELQACDLSYYALYREPKHKFSQNVLKKTDYNYPIDFLDTADDLIPDDMSFCLNIEKLGRLVLIRSIVWPGMCFFHKLYTKKHGFCYFGNGKRNFDLLFMM